MKKLKILIVDDEVRLLQELEEFLGNKKFTVFKALKPSIAFDILEKNEIDILILDIKLPEMNGIDVLKKVKEQYPEIEVIMVSGHGDMTTVIEAMRFGATDYFPKPFRLLDINNAIARTKRFIELNNELKDTKSTLSILSKKLMQNIGVQILGNSKAVGNLIDLMTKVARTENTSVLVLGESGTGKELVAHGIHYLSSRSKNTFYSVNCSAVPESLFESEFFGHKKGSFTGATDEKDGWFENANNGTLFLDEISDMPLIQQAKLLRVLEERKVNKIGSRKSVNVDVRVIAASNKNLEEMALENKFRLDLFHRLSIFIIEIPPLRDRKEDIPILLDYYVKFYSQQMGNQIRTIDAQVIDMLMNYDFPGNIRELKNMIERAVILCEDEILSCKHFRLNNKNSINKVKPDANKIDEDNLDLEDNIKTIIIKALEKTNNNKSKAAELLNITWQALDRRIKKLGIE
ncbi:MAG: DNA-binding response regulator [Marinilabiliales bacterium]|nr:MAG: DNA-binding response regulator [Marinilabiliales bacterium]